MWVPDEGGAPVWVQLLGEPASPVDAADGGDADENGVADWLDSFHSAQVANTVSYWSGGTFVVDGVSTAYGGTWHATTPDTDGDQIPDDLDPHPSDPTNNSFYWAGGTRTINGITHAFRAGWYGGSEADDNNNTVPDALDDWFTTPSLHGALQHWNGGTLTINGQQSTFDPVDYYASQFVDSDSDGIPDELDPYPSDPWNNSNYPWVGGDYAINGVLTHLPPATYGGAWADVDGDGIPDVVDPLPNDSANNSAWWQGGTFSIDGAWVTFPAQWHQANASDTDGDGLPDDIDPLPASYPNWHTFSWAGGLFTINSQATYFPPNNYYGTMVDSDGDGIPDVLDPFPMDPNNGNVTDHYAWAGGVYLIDNQTQTLQAGSFAGSWSDIDGDGIPDPVDPYPNTAANGNNQFYWGGGWFSFDNQNTFFPAGNYPGNGVDSDADGVPDVCDTFPTAASNGNDTYTWGGGTFRIGGSDQVLAGGTFAGAWVDTDGDGIPEGQDPFPTDPNNDNPGIPTASFHWAGGTFRIANSDQVFADDTYPGTWADGDGDGIPDSVDTYVSDATNGNTTYYWAGGTFRIANVDQLFAPGTHNGVLADSDADGIPDGLDPYPEDPNNANTSFYWAGGVFRIDNGNQTFDAGYYDGSYADGDADGIPDSVDPYASDATNGNTRFHWVGGLFTVNNLQVFFQPRDFDGTWSDADNDNIPDSLDSYPTDPLNGNSVEPPHFHWVGGFFRVDGVYVFWPEADYIGIEQYSDSDSIPDSLDIYPTDGSNNSASWVGGQFQIDGHLTTLPDQWHRANSPDRDSDGIPDDIDPYPTDAENHPGFDWPATPVDILVDNQSVSFVPTHYGVNWSDVDDDGIPDIADPFPLDTYNHNDGDDDGIPDAVEALYPDLLDLAVVDSSAVRSDGLTFLQAYLYYPQYPLDQLVDVTLDSDHDGIPDVFEILHGLNPFNVADAVASKRGDFVSNLEKYMTGLDLNVAITQQEYESVTGQSWALFLLNHNQNLADAEDDPDGDGVSNIDELLIFHTNRHDIGSRPSNSEIVAAIMAGRVSATTLIHFNSLVTPPGNDDPGSGEPGGGTTPPGGGTTPPGGGTTPPGGGTTPPGGGTTPPGGGTTPPSGSIPVTPPLPSDIYDQELVMQANVETVLSASNEAWVCEGALTPTWLNGILEPWVLWSQRSHSTVRTVTVSLWRWKLKTDSSWNTEVPLIPGAPVTQGTRDQVNIHYQTLSPGQAPAND